jgi:hypothetical protein
VPSVKYPCWSIGDTERDLNIILAPGDITYKIFGRLLGLYWDFAYNFSGDDRFNGDY